MTRKLLLATLLAIPFLIESQEDKKDSKTWDVSNPGSEFNYKNYRFTTGEGRTQAIKKYKKLKINILNKK